MKQTIMDDLNFQLREAKINKLLQLTLMAHFSLNELGQKERANKVLQLGSKHALDLMALYGVGSAKVFCPTCHQQLTNGIEIEAFNHSNECLLCENLRSDEATEVLND